MEWERENVEWECESDGMGMWERDACGRTGVRTECIGTTTQVMRM